MIHKVFWQIPGRILVIQHNGTLLIENMMETSKWADLIMSNEGLLPSVHIIIDLSGCKGLAPNVMDVRGISKVARTVNANPMQGYTVVVDPVSRPVMRSIGSAVMQVTRMRFRIVITMDEAISFLSGIDETLLTAPETKNDVYDIRAKYELGFSKSS